MNVVRRIAFIGNALPRRCGIATFTTDLEQAIKQSSLQIETGIVVMTDHGHEYDYPHNVVFQIQDDLVADYALAARYLNEGGFDVVSLQHEFGIFGGDAGGHILELLMRLQMPVVTTLHTVLAEPTAIQRATLERILALSARVIVMAEKGRDLLRSVWDVAPEKIDVIPHGIPDVPFAEPDAAKALLGFSGRAVILTFGLLSPNKGIEVMIEAMPDILKRRPDAVYVVLGATHPNLARREGEAYREELLARVQALGIAEHVVLLDQFVERGTLLEYISMCDVYVTPYLTEAQMTSGTLAYSFGLGKAVVSTPYWHARELLADGRGVLVPFGDASVIGEEIGDLLTDDARRLAMRQRAYASSRSMIWRRAAERYMESFALALRSHAVRRFSPPSRMPPASAPADSAIRTGHFRTMCDDTGLFQHAIHSVPDRAHGYCIDDNARALLVACALSATGEEPLPEQLSACFAAFIQYAWNADRRRFRNFMSFQRAWLEDIGSEDSQGRTLWALGECSRNDASPSRRRWAAGLFALSMMSAEEFRAPRAWAFTLLGLDAYCAAQPEDETAQRLRVCLANRLMKRLARSETPKWPWFEDCLAYDNARLPQALIVTGLALGRPDQVAAGMRTLRWLMARQTSPAGLFRPVGTESFGRRRRAPACFDQQPLEAAATISACLAAWTADGDHGWKIEASRALGWFHGRNDLAADMIDPETGGCRDGLHPDRPNENRGAESVVSYLLSVIDMRQFERRIQTARPPMLVQAGGTS